MLPRDTRGASFCRFSKPDGVRPQETRYEFIVDQVLSMMLETFQGSIQANNSMILW